MGVIEPKNKAIKKHRGLHVYHAGLSNCAMRVRIVLEEKGLNWESHLLDLMAGEHLTKEYIDINPNAVVPTLIDNGEVVTDSSDIIDYLDQKYNSGSLRPDNEDELWRMYRWIYLARDNHLSVKTYMYSNVSFFGKMKKSTHQLDDYSQKQTVDMALLEFHRKFSSFGGFTQEDTSWAKAVLDDCFLQMSDRLGDHEWLAGDRFSLADIAWIPQLVILNIAKFPFENHPGLSKWKQAVMSRSSFKRGVLDWMPNPKPVD